MDKDRELSRLLKNYYLTIKSILEVTSEDIDLKTEKALREDMKSIEALFND